jgi:hypothetical protein
LRRRLRICVHDDRLIFLCHTEPFEAAQDELREKFSAPAESRNWAETPPRGMQGSYSPGLHFMSSSPSAGDIPLIQCRITEGTARRQPPERRYRQ